MDVTVKEVIVRGIHEVATNFSAIPVNKSLPFSELKKLMPALAYKGKTNKKGEPHGKGVITHPNSAEWAGIFEDGHFRKGQLSSGYFRRWEGEFVNLFPCGHVIKQMTGIPEVMEGDFFVERMVQRSFLFPNGTPFGWLLDVTYRVGKGPVVVHAADMKIILEARPPGVRYSVKLEDGRRVSGEIPGDTCSVDGTVAVGLMPPPLEDFVEDMMPDASGTVTKQEGALVYEGVLQAMGFKCDSQSTRGMLISAPW